MCKSGGSTHPPRGGTWLGFENFWHLSFLALPWFDLAWLGLACLTLHFPVMSCRAVLPSFRVMTPLPSTVRPFLAHSSFCWYHILIYGSYQMKGETPIHQLPVHSEMYSTEVETMFHHHLLGSVLCFAVSCFFRWCLALHFSLSLRCSPDSFVGYLLPRFLLLIFSGLVRPVLPVLSCLVPACLCPV